LEHVGTAIKAAANQLLFQAPCHPYELVVGYASTQNQNTVNIGRTINNVVLNITLQRPAVNIQFTVSINVTYKYIMLFFFITTLDRAWNCHEQAPLRHRLCIWSVRIHKLPDENYLTAYEDKTRRYLLKKNKIKNKKNRRRRRRRRRRTAE